MLDLNINKKNKSSGPRVIGVKMVKSFTDLMDNSADLLKKEAESALDLSGEFKTHAKDNDVLLGLESKAKAGIQERGAALARSVQEIRENQAKKNKQRSDDIMLIVLLDDIRRKVQEAEEFLQREFGENYLVVLSQQYGVDISGMTHQQGVKALVEEFSKDKYKDDAIVQKALPALQSNY